MGWNSPKQFPPQKLPNLSLQVILPFFTFTALCSASCVLQITKQIHHTGVRSVCCPFHWPRYHFQSKVWTPCSDLVPNLSNFPSARTQYSSSMFLYRCHQISSQISTVVVTSSLAIHNKIYSNSFLTESHIIQISFIYIHRNTLLNIIWSYIHMKQ